MNHKHLTELAALSLALVIAACTGQTDSAQQIIICPINALASDQTELTRDECIEKLVTERDSFHSQLKRSTAAEARLLVEIQAKESMEPGPILNEKEKWLAACLEPAPETIATTAWDIKQALREAREAYRRCLPELTIYNLMDEATQLEHYPDIQTTAEEIQKRLDQLVQRKIQALYAAITLNGGFTPTLFCDGDCEVKGRHELVYELATTLEANNLGPEVVEKKLTMEDLMELRVLGIKELFDLWFEADSDSVLKVHGKGKLCFEIELHPSASGLSDTELTELNCGEHISAPTEVPSIPTPIPDCTTKVQEARKIIWHIHDLARGITEANFGRVSTEIGNEITKVLEALSLK